MFHKCYTHVSQLFLHSIFHAYYFLSTIVWPAYFNLEMKSWDPNWKALDKLKNISPHRAKYENWLEHGTNVIAFSLFERLTTPKKYRKQCVFIIFILFHPFALLDVWIHIVYTFTRIHLNALMKIAYSIASSLMLTLHIYLHTHIWAHSISGICDAKKKQTKIFFH